jgi:hypothetical protein
MTIFGKKLHRSRVKTSSFCLGAIAVGFILALPNAITSIEAPVADDCAASIDQQFEIPSSARDEAFISCIVEKDPSTTRDELRHKLETGSGNGLVDRLTSGESLPAGSDASCRYLRVAVQSPVGSNEEEQKPMRDLFSEALTREGFKVVDPSAMHHWWASSLALDTGDNSAAWTILVRATPEIGGGGIHFTTVRKTVDGREGSFSGMQLLRAFAKHEAPEAARLAAKGIAKELLPAAHRRCSDANLAFEETWGQLEKLRNELTQEIERVRRAHDERERASGVKQLEIEVEAEG